MKKIICLALCAMMIGSVSAMAGTRGDFTGTGKVDITDLVALKKNIATVEKYDYHYDLDGDKNVGSGDIVKMQEYLLGKIANFGLQNKGAGDGEVIVVD